MPWILSYLDEPGRRPPRERPPCTERRSGSRRPAAGLPRALLVGAVLVLLVLVADAAPALAGYGGGYGGSGGGGIWAAAWWVGNPEGPGPYIGPPSGATSRCSWLDVGSTVTDLGDALARIHLPKSFWRASRGGAAGGIWAVTRWASPLENGGSATDHFDLVGCPRHDEVPMGGGDVYSSLPEVRLPDGTGVHVWIFWDTVPDPPSTALPPVVDEAFQRVDLLAPSISMSPWRVGNTKPATLVHLPTWLWVGTKNWRTVWARATAGPYTATVWAQPVSVTWSAYWNITSPSQDPEHGTTFGPDRLSETCVGPGVPYPLVSGRFGPACTATFSQSTLGSTTPLEARITWAVYWALADNAGVVGGEGTLADATTSSWIPLRVMQVESVVSSG